MEKRRNSGLIGRARRVLMVGVPAVGLAVTLVGAAPAETAQAQLEDLGDNIASAVSGAVSGVATNSTTTSGGTVSGDTVTGATSVQQTDSSLGEEEGTAVSDASGGNYNVGANPRNNE